MILKTKHLQGLVGLFQLCKDLLASILFFILEGDLIPNSSGGLLM